MVARLVCICLPLFVAGVGLLAGPEAAEASLAAPEVVIRPVLPHRPLEAGTLFEIPVDIYVREDVTLTGVGLAGERRSRFTLVLDRPAADAAPEGYRVQRHLLRGRLGAEPSVARIRVTAVGRVFEEAVTLTGLGDKAAQLVEVPEHTARALLTRDATTFERPEPVPSGFPTLDGARRSGTRTVSVQGRVTMFVSDSTTTREVDGATVYFMQVRDILDDLELGSTTTDVNGHFAFDVSMDGTHDVYIKVRAINSVANIGTDAGFQTYGRNLPTVSGFSGTSFDAGTIRFAADEMNHALWLLTTYTRTHRWLADTGFDLPSVNCRWPDDGLGSSVYLPILGLEGIHLTSGATWNGGTAVHEYGHHFVAASPLQESWPPIYTNGVCDPGHCGWCQENESVAWSEGVPHFMQQVINEDHTTIYGWTQPSIDRFESHSTCPETGVLGEFPASTENFFAAFLHDLVDASPDGSTLAPGITERSQLTVDDVLAAAVSGGASSSLDYLDDLRAYLAAHPTYGDPELSEFWAAAAVNGLESDTVPPQPPTLISVPTHPVGVPSPSNLPIMSFSGATDDNSGVDRYRVSIDASPQMPGPGGIISLSASFAWPNPLAEGPWHINVMAIDRAGNESTTFATFGPIVVGPQTPVDLVPWRPGLWEDTFLLRHTPDVTAAAGAVETQLIGGQSFYVSLSSRNESPSSAASSSFIHAVDLDGQPLTSQFFGSGVIAGHEEFQFLNLGPHEVAGGRHHFTIQLDANGNVAEELELNNFDDRYVVFRPSILAPGAWVDAPAAPDPYTTGLHATQTYPNVAGHRVVPANDFAAVMLRTADVGVDYTMRLHEASMGYDDGFEMPLAASATSGGQIETIILNDAQLAGASFDAGAERVSGGSSDGYSIRHVSSQTFTPGDDVVLHWEIFDHLALLEATFGVLETGPFTVEVDVSFDDPTVFEPLEIYWIDDAVETLVPHAIAPTAVTDANGDVTLELTVPSPGTYCLAIFRDQRVGGAPREAPRRGGVSQPLTIAVSTTTVPQPDLTIFRDNHFWELPFIPAFEPQLPPDISVPAQLVGGAETYLNLGIFNAGQVDVENLSFFVGLDGVGQETLFSSEVQFVEGLQATQFYGDTPVTVPGGRHTLVVQLDALGEVDERDETNNLFAVQFGWEGPALDPGEVSFRSAPPVAEGGIEVLELFTSPGVGGDSGAQIPINFRGLNSDGFRLQSVSSRGGAGAWLAVGTMPLFEPDLPDVDVDVRLHEVMDPARAFTMPTAASTWGPGESDFVLIDGHTAPSEPYDVSVVDARGQSGYAISAVASTFLTSPPDVYGTFEMNAGEFLQLYEVRLDAGSYEVQLVPQDEPDMGLSVYRPTRPLEAPFWSKDDGRDRVPMAYLTPGEDPEKVTFVVPHGGEGYHAIAVWKVSSVDLLSSIEYELEIDVTPAASPCLDVDGWAEEAYGPPLSVQTTATAAGDAGTGAIDAADGSELDQALAKICDGTLYLALTGNLASTFEDLEIFLDTAPGGQNRLRGDNHSFGGLADLNRLGDDGSGNGLTFDDGFAPDWWIGLQGGFGEASGGGTIPYKLMAYQAELLTAGGGDGRFLGATVAGSTGILGGAGSENPEGVRVTIDNRNTGGVSEGTGPDSGAGVITGVELAIPLAAIGDPLDTCIKICAFVNGREHDAVSNQVLGPLPPGTDNLGEPREVDFDDHEGLQLFVVCPDGATGLEGEVATDSVPHAVLHGAAPNPFNPRTTISFLLPSATDVDLEIFDLAGRRVRTLASAAHLPAGRHRMHWSGLDDGGRRVASGVYLLRLSTPEVTRAHRLTLLR